MERVRRLGLLLLSFIAVFSPMGLLGWEVGRMWVRCGVVLLFGLDWRLRNVEFGKMRFLFRLVLNVFVMISMGVALVL